MANILINNLILDYEVFKSGHRSIKKKFLSKATGGKIEDSIKKFQIRALDGISLEISDGDVIGLTGHNGSGKTTLLKVIAGIYEPTSGSIDIDGSLSCFISPNAGLNVELNGIENIKTMCLLRGFDLDKIEKIIEDVKNFSELDDYINLPVKTYSAGMLSRLGFSISTSMNSEILLVDEGLGAGDKNFQDKVKKRLNSFLENSKISIYATHDEPYLKSIGAKIIKLEKGKII